MYHFWNNHKIIIFTFEKNSNMLIQLYNCCKYSHYRHCFIKMYFLDCSKKWYTNLFSMFLSMKLKCLFKSKVCFIGVLLYIQNLHEQLIKITKQSYYDKLKQGRLQLRNICVISIGAVIIEIPRGTDNYQGESCLYFRKDLSFTVS